MPGGRRKYQYYQVVSSRTPIIEERSPEIYNLSRPSRGRTIIIQESSHRNRRRIERPPSPVILEARPERPTRRPSPRPRVITISPTRRTPGGRDRSPRSRRSALPTPEELAAEMSPRPPATGDTYVALPEPLPDPDDRKKSRRDSKSWFDVDEIFGSGHKNPKPSKSKNKFKEYEVITSPGEDERRGPDPRIPRTLPRAESRRPREEPARPLQNLREEKRLLEGEISGLMRSIDSLRLQEIQARQRWDYENAQARQQQLENYARDLRQRELRVQDLERRLVAPPPGPPVVNQPVQPRNPQNEVEDLIFAAQDDRRQREQTQQLYRDDRERHRTAGQRRGSFRTYEGSYQRPRNT